MVKTLILRTAGTNCDLETKLAFEIAGAKSYLWHINRVKQNPAGLKEFNILCFPGGFTYGDDISAGKILANQIKFWLKNEISAFLNKGGIILGICNGFQVLVKAGILPDCGFRQKISLLANTSGKFEDRWVYLEINRDKINKTACNIWLKGLPETICLPIAHAEGRFYAEKEQIKQLQENRQIIFRYSDKTGKVKESYPFNPNGSMYNIAGITDLTGRVLGLMPHPERYLFKEHIPFWQKERNIIPFGRKIFENAVNYFKQ